MELVFGFDSLEREISSIVSVGSFDGVHAGHRAIMSRMNTLRKGVESACDGGRESACEEGVESNCDEGDTSQNLRTVVVTFSPHPRHFIGGDKSFRLLNTIDEKALLLASCGIDAMVVARFDEEFMNTTSAQFVDILYKKLDLKVLMAGYNHRLGCDGVGGIEALESLLQGYDASVEVMPEFFVGEHRVSSTVVRRAIQRGDMTLACELLERPYFALLDTVQSQNNTFSVSETKLLPPDGFYAARPSDLEGCVLIDNIFIEVREQSLIMPEDICVQQTLCDKNKFLIEFL